MKAFVLVADAGKRLRPLAIDIPKPMIPILRKPALYHTFLNLKNNGFDSVCANLYHHPDTIMSFKKNNDTSTLNWISLSRKNFWEQVGAIKNKESFFDDTFVVMSEDGLSDINLGKAVDFHKKIFSYGSLEKNRFECCIRCCCNR